MARVRIEFAKGDPVRFLSHLDLMKAFERAIRRAQIPIAFSEGFNPHPRMNFASALAVGVTSEKEYLDIDLKNDMELKELAARLDKALPPGIVMKSVRSVPDKAPPLMAVVNRAEYVVTAELEGLLDTGEMKRKITDFMDRSEVNITKRTKKGPRQKNIRPGILKFEADIFDTKIDFFISTVTGNEGNVRPEEVICAFVGSTGLPVDCETLYIKRIALYVDEGGEMLDPMDYYTISGSRR
ncbi:MAG: radical SAM protein [Firmicutes bacterium HGW-Firmicutes-14]|nr:MAG: radical SAM protein [Firmicutes bacterium HGW-Firmicutes-14]